MESPAHQALKSWSASWLLAVGCCAAADEVPCPLSRWRLDAAGYMDFDPRKRHRDEPTSDTAQTTRAMAPRAMVDPPRWLRCPVKASEPTTIIIECKAMRSDFLRDARQTDRLIARRQDLLRELVSLEEEFIKPGNPDLRRRGNFLFGEMETWDLDASPSPIRGTLLRELRRLDDAIHGHTKFFMLRRYRLATHLLIAAAPGVVQPYELPMGWGLLEGDGESVRVVAEPVMLEPSERVRQRLLRNVASVLTSRSGIGGGAAGKVGGLGPLGDR